MTNKNERCGRCAGTGIWAKTWEIDLDTGENRPSSRGAHGTCFRCGGKGYQTPADVRRNNAFDIHYINRSAT